jgi:hypothetical protein
LRISTVPLAVLGVTVTCEVQAVPLVTVGQVAETLVLVGGVGVMVTLNVDVDDAFLASPA